MAQWIWLSDWQHAQNDRAIFELDFELECEQVIQFDTTADQRYILSLNGIEVGRGPDRSELHGWSFHRYKGTLPKGKHRLAADVWWLDHSTDLEHRLPPGLHLPW
ncbi:MAG: hypothetical protein LR015_09770 [Verrucomicrobia bacterium]|nr:hypothetical protein [Verrucomicrobiota bacterium]